MSKRANFKYDNQAFKHFTNASIVAHSDEQNRKIPLALSSTTRQFILRNAEQFSVSPYTFAAIHAQAQYNARVQTVWQDQIHAAFSPHHGLFIIGVSGGGKTVMFRIVEDGLTASHLEAESWLTALRAYDPKRADEIERDIKNRIAIITKANNSNNNAFSSFQDDSKETEDPWAARTRRNMAARKNLSDQTDMVFSSDDMIAKFCVLPHINTSNGFIVKAGNPRKHKEAAKSLLLDLGESSLPAVAYTGAEFNLSSVPHLRTSLIMCGTAQDMRYLMQWRGDGRQSRMHIVTAQRIISCSSKSYYTTNNWMQGIREYSL
eukprot:1036757_1